MVCLRCGYCCRNYTVMVVDNPKKGIALNNIIEVDEHNTDIRCPHLKGHIAGQYACSIHEKSWYKKTPCYDFGQIEPISGSLCRMGKYVMENEKKEGRKNEKTPIL